jgi:hypothetical protein
MTLPSEESIQEGLARLSEKQRSAVDPPAPAGPTLVRDARRLNTLSDVRGWSLFLGFLLLVLTWSVSPPATEWAWLYIPASVGAWTFAASYFVSSTSMALMLLLDPSRYRQAWVYISASDPGASGSPPPDRDARALLRIRGVWGWSLSSGLLLLLFWIASPAGTDMVWLSIPVSMGAWMFGTSFVVSTAAIVLLFILSPRRYRLARAQIGSTGPPAPERPPLDRDARTLRGILTVWIGSLIVGTFLLTPLAYWSTTPSGTDLVWLDILVSLGAMTLGTSFVVSSAAITLLVILNPRRYWRAWVQIRGEGGGGISVGF